MKTKKELIKAIITKELSNAATFFYDEGIILHHNNSCYDESEEVLIDQASFRYFSGSSNKGVNYNETTESTLKSQDIDFLIYKMMEYARNNKISILQVLKNKGYSDTKEIYSYDEYEYDSDGFEIGCLRIERNIDLSIQELVEKKLQLRRKKIKKSK